MNSSTSGWLVLTRNFVAGSHPQNDSFVRQLEPAHPLPFRRMESEPGQEAQVDFGQGAWVVEQGRRRRPHVLRVVLSHSRKGYTEACWRQTTENFVRGLENALRHFGISLCYLPPCKEVAKGWRKGRDSNPR